MTEEDFIALSRRTDASLAVGWRMGQIPSAEEVYDLFRIISTLREAAEACKDFVDETADECGHQPTWQAASRALNLLPSLLGVT